MVIYVPGTEEIDPKKQNMSLQQLGGATETLQGSVVTNTANIATNTANIATNTASIAVHEAAWTTYTPTASADTGTITTLGTRAGRYLKIGKTVFVQVDVPITTNGTGSAFVNISIPFTAGAGIYFLSGREQNVGGKMLVGRISAGGTNAGVFNYDNSYPGGDGTRLLLSGAYEST